MTDQRVSTSTRLRNLIKAEPIRNSKQRVNRNSLAPSYRNRKVLHGFLCSHTGDCTSIQHLIKFQDQEEKKIHHRQAINVLASEERTKFPVEIHILSTKTDTRYLKRRQLSRGNFVGQKKISRRQKGHHELEKKGITRDTEVKFQDKSREHFVVDISRPKDRVVV